MTVGHRDEHLVTTVGAPHQRLGDDRHDQPAERVAPVELPHVAALDVDPLAAQPGDVAVDERRFVRPPDSREQAGSEQVGEVRRATPSDTVCQSTTTTRSPPKSRLSARKSPCTTVHGSGADAR